MTTTDNEQIDPAATYKVELLRAVKIGKAQTTVLSPRSEMITMTGAMLKTIEEDAVASYVKI